MYLEAATSGNSDLLRAWAQQQTMTEELNPSEAAPTYDKYHKYLLLVAKKLEISVEVNTPAHKANLAETDYLSQKSPSDPDYQHANDLSTYMGVQDEDFVQYVLECNKAINAGKPRPKQRTRRRSSLNKDLMIQDAWKEMSREH